MSSTTFARRDPFSEMTTLRHAMDRVFAPAFLRFPAVRGAGSEDLGTNGLGLDIYETNDELVVKAAVPGVDPANVDISVDDDVLTIKGSYQTQDETKNEQYHRRELRSGSFERALRLPPTVDPANATATFENGLLKLTLPKKQEARAKTFKITPLGVIDTPTPTDQPQQG